MMRVVQSVLPFLLLLLFVSGCGEQPTEAPKKPLSKGQEIFLTHCVSCHMGVGDPPGPNAVVLDSAKLQLDSRFESFLRKPVSAMMPSFDEHLISKDDAQKLYAYLLEAKAPPQ